MNEFLDESGRRLSIFTFGSRALVVLEPSHRLYPLPAHSTIHHTHGLDGKGTLQPGVSSTIINLFVSNVRILMWKHSGLSTRVKIYGTY